MPILQAALMRRIRRPLLWVVLFMLSLMSGVTSAQQLEWLRRFGAAGYYDDAFGVAVDATGVYVTGRTKAPLPGTTGTGLDAYVRKYGFQGNVLWTRQFNISGADESFAIAVDGQGSYVAGRTEGSVYGAFVSRLDLAGNLVWSHVFDFRKLTEAWSIAVHRTGIYVAGDVLGVDTDAVLAKLDFDGNEIWTTPRGIGTSNNDKFTGVTVDDTGVYGVGVIGAADVRKFDFDGQEVAQFGNGDFKGAFSGNVIAQDSTGIYTVGNTGVYYYDYKLRKYSRTGALLWEKALELDAGALAVDGNGVYVIFSNVWGQQPHVAKYTLNGDFIWQGGFGQSLATYGGAVHNGDVYLTGAAFGATEDDTNSYVARYSATRPPQLLSLGSIDGAPAIATLVHDTTVPSVVARVRNAVSGAQISRVNFSPLYHPQELVVVPDRNGNGAPELVLLGVHEMAGNVVTEIRDSRSGKLLNTVTFDKTYMPRRLAVVPDVGVNDQPGLAVLGASSIDRSLRVEITDSVTGAPVQSVDFSRWYLNEPFADFTVVPDTNGNGSPELAVMVITIPMVESRSVVKDALSGETISEAWFESNYCPRDFVVAPDLDGNGGVELATLLKGCWGGKDRVQVDIRNVLTGTQSGIIGYNKFARPVALVVLPDQNGNGGPELGVMALNVGTDKDVLSIKDIPSNLWIRSIVFQRAGYQHRGVAQLPDVNGNNSPDLAQLQERRRDGKLRVLIKDTETGAFIRYVQQ